MDDDNLHTSFEESMYWMLLAVLIAVIIAEGLTIIGLLLIQT